MAAVDVEDLRQELAVFAEGTLQRQLDLLLLNIRDILRDETGSPRRACTQEQNLTATDFALPHVAEVGHAVVAPEETALRVNSLTSRISSKSSSMRRPLGGFAASRFPSVEDDGELELLIGKIESQKAVKMPRTKSMAGMEMNFHVSSLARKKGGLAGGMSEDPDFVACGRVTSSGNLLSVSPSSPKPFNIGDHFVPAGAVSSSLSPQRTTVATKWEVGPLRMKAIEICRSYIFEHSVIYAIICNAVYIGIATQWMAMQVLGEPPLLFDVVEFIFLGVFVGELCLKFFAYRLQLFRYVFTAGANAGMRNPDFYWNIFDWSVIGLQLIELVFRWADINVEILHQVSLLRALRVVRITRILRLVKVFAFVKDLRTIVNSLTKSMSLFLWSICALLVGTYLWAVFFTEAVLAEKLHLQEFGGPDAAEKKEALDRYFRSLDITMLSLLQAVTGGLDWGDVAEPLRTMTTFAALVPFLIYVLFAMLAMMNVISGIFLEFATERAKEETEYYLMQNARMIFAEADHNDNGTITWPDFAAVLSNPSMERFFDAIDLDIADAHTLFTLLDNSGDGTISAEEFLCGCVRLRGPARSLDLVVLARQVAELAESNRQTTLMSIRSTQANKEAILINQKLLSDLNRSINDLHLGPRRHSLK